MGWKQLRPLGLKEPGKEMVFPESPRDGTGRRGCPTGHGGTWQLPELQCQSPEGTGKQSPDLSLRLTFTFLPMAPTDLTQSATSQQEDQAVPSTGFPHQGTESDKKSREWVSESEQERHPMAMVECTVKRTTAYP